MTPDIIIKTIRDSYVHSETIYTQGGCYQFHLILKEIFPQSICWYDSIEGHVITEIHEKYYDITGEVYLPAMSYPLEEEPRILEEAKTWRFEWGNCSNQIY